MSSMLRIPKKRGKTLSYNKENIERALQAIQSGDSIRKASAEYGIPKSTLGDRLSGRIDPLKPVVHGRPPAIPPAVEERIVESVKSAARMGVGLSRKQILSRTFILCKRAKIQSSYKNFKAGKDWWEGLKRRHPELSLRKPEKLSTVRARMLNKAVVDNYFDTLESVIRDLGVTGDEIWNCDETGLNFEHSPPRIVTEKGATSVVSKTSQKSSNLTIMACINGSGRSMPSLVITKGKTAKSLHGFKTGDAPIGTVWSFQEKGWITDDIGEQWFDNVFLKHCGSNRPQLLIFDGHSSHESLAIIERALTENIVLISLPPHCTHFLQPLDRAVFGPFKKAYNEHCANFMAEHPLHVVNKWTFPSLLTRAWETSFTESNIKSGFSSCGIHPLNRTAIPQSAYAPSVSTDVPYKGDEQPVQHLNDISAPNSPSTREQDNQEEILLATKVITVQNEEENLEAIDIVPMDSQTQFIDLSDPAQLYNLIRSGELIVSEEEQPHISSTNVSELIDDVFLPPKLDSCPESKSRVTKKTSHTILTSEEILQQKRILQEKKEEKQAKKSKKIKKENI